MRKFFLLVGALFIGITALAQSQMMLYQFNKRLPQSNQLNPSLFPDYKVSVGLPVLSSTYATFNGGKATFNNAFTRSDDDSLHFDPQKLASNLDETNRIEVNGNALIFYLGLRIKKNFISLALNERVDVGLTYPRTFVELIGSGNGSADGGLLAFDNLGLQAQAYHELALGYGREINDKLSIGFRAKMLSGVVGASVDNISAGLLTTTDSLYLYSGAFNVNLGGYDLIESEEDIDIFQAATAFGNTGFAFDFGANYDVTDKLNVSLSVTDLGSINWTDNNRQLQFSEVKYSFNGFDLLDVLEGDTDSLFQKEADALVEQFEPDTVDNVEFSTKLSTKLYAGASYQLGNAHTFGLLFYGDVFRGTFNPAFGISYNLTLGHIWTIGVNASYRNSSFKNFGIGTALKLGPVQLYFLSENIMAFSQIQDASLVDARLGMNLVFGKMSKSEKVKKQKKTKEKREPAIDMGL